MTDRPSRTDAERALAAKTEWHRRQARLPVRDKVRILLELQRQDYPLLRQHRALEWWERPWEVEP